MNTKEDHIHGKINGKLAKKAIHRIKTNFNPSSSKRQFLEEIR
ncbi:MAG: hypothetical protein WC589_19245 [Sphingobacterium sp.]